MFKRFTERARRVIILAREEAELYRHEYLGTEHILQGVIKDGGGIAIAIVQKSGVDIDSVEKGTGKKPAPQFKFPDHRGYSLHLPSQESFGVRGGGGPSL